MFQVFVNVGMTIGIMPITGVTLPLMSYGGSSVISTLLAVGLLQSIYVQARTAAAEGPRAPLLNHVGRASPAPPKPARSRGERPRRRVREPSRRPEPRRRSDVALGLARSSDAHIRCSAGSNIERLNQIEKASTCQRRSRGDARRASGGDRNARRLASPRPAAIRRPAQGAAARRPVIGSLSSTSSAAAGARSSATSTRARSTTSCPAWRPRSSISAWRRTASCTSTRSCCPAWRRPSAVAATAAGARSPTCSSPARRSSCRWSRTPSRRRARGCRWS